MSIQLYGTVNETDSYFCDYLAKKIAKTNSSLKYEANFYLEVDFLTKRHELRAKYGGFINRSKKNHIVLLENEVIGDVDSLIPIAIEKYSIEDAEVQNTILFNRHVREDTDKYLQMTGRTIVHIQFEDKSPLKKNELIEFDKIYIELFEDICPKACENFKLLCSTAEKSYLHCPIHRIVKDGWFQCGDVIDGSGKNSMAALDKSKDNLVQDESFTVDFGFINGGIVGFANSGPHTNGSQFFITFGPCDFLNNHFVGVGRIIQGFSTLQKLNFVPVANQKPTRNIIISSCGVEK